MRQKLSQTRHQIYKDRIRTTIKTFSEMPSQHLIKSKLKLWNKCQQVRKNRRYVRQD